MTENSDVILQLCQGCKKDFKDLEPVMLQAIDTTLLDHKLTQNQKLMLLNDLLVATDEAFTDILFTVSDDEYESLIKSAKEEFIKILNKY